MTRSQWVEAGHGGDLVKIFLLEKQNERIPMKKRRLRLLIISCNYILAGKDKLERRVDSNA